jgi:thymidylate synthase
MTSFNPKQAQECPLYPCHSIVLQFYVESNNRLSLVCYNRSQDLFLGVVWNLTYASLLIHLFCEVINNDNDYKGEKLSPGRLIMNLGDTHVYEEHKEQTIRQILREPYPFPKLIIKRKVNEITDFKFEDFELVDYHCYPNIIAKMIA